MTEWLLARIPSPEKKTLLGAVNEQRPLTTVWLSEAVNFQMHQCWSVASRQNKHVLFSSHVWQRERV